MYEENQQYYNPLAVEAAEKGAALFDRVKPGWAQSIDLSDFDIGSCSRCAVGQVFGHYCDTKSAVLTVIEPETDWKPLSTFRATHTMIEHGNDLMEKHGFDSNTDYTAHELTIAWRELIEKRRANA